MAQMTFRMAQPADTALILHFIQSLAVYEKMEDQVIATEDLLNEWLFEKQKAEVLIGEAAGRPVGFALFFHNFSTFLGRAGIYLEDLFVEPDARGCGRLEWSCLDWNQPSIDFYLSMGAERMDDWTTYRLTGDRLAELGRAE